MKNKYLTLLLTLIPCLSFAQKPGFSIGGEAGFNLSKIKGMNLIIRDPWSPTIFESEFTNTIGQVGGLFGQIHFNKYLSLQTGFYYEDKGQNYKYFVPLDPAYPELTDKYYHLSYRIDTRVVPLLLRVQFGEKKLKSFVNLGGYASYIKHFHVMQTEPKYSTIRDVMLDDDWFKRNEYGVSGGIGISYTLKENVSFSFELRTNQGLRDIQDNFPNSDSEYFKLSTLNFLFGVTHHLTNYSKSQNTKEVSKQ